MRLASATNVTGELYQAACSLLDQAWDRKTPLRQLGVSVTQLADGTLRQYSLFDAADYARQEKLDTAVDALREKFGEGALFRAALLHGDERMAVHDLRKHVAWYLKGFPVGGSTRKAFMECESLDDVRREIGRLDPNMVFPQRVVDKPRGRVRFAKKVHVPYGWLESRTTTHEERETLFGDDPMDAGY